MRMRLFLSMARAIQNSWRWPREKLAPLSATCGEKQKQVSDGGGQQETPCS
jgi:hypothetical protein